MKDLYLTLILVVIFICTIWIGFLVTNYNKKEKYNLLNHFPFEMKSESLKLTLIFRFTLALFCGICSIASIILLFVNGTYLLERFLSCLLVFNSFMLVNLFVIDMHSYKSHLFNSVIFMVINLLSYFLLFYLPIRDDFVYYSLFILITSLIVFLTIMVLLFLPTLKKWYIIKYDEKNQEKRGKLLPLALIEWINIFLYVLIYILIAINYLLFIYK